MPPPFSHPDDTLWLSAYLNVGLESFANAKELNV
jgi:hypothetical protein